MIAAVDIGGTKIGVGVVDSDGRVLSLSSWRVCCRSRSHKRPTTSTAKEYGPFEMLSDETFVLIFGGANQTRDLNQGLFEDVREQKGRAELVGEGAASPPFALPNAPRSIHPILEILPVQMITLALAVRGGREPGRFELATKVTTRE